MVKTLVSESTLRTNLEWLDKIERQHLFHVSNPETVQRISVVGFAHTEKDLTWARATISENAHLPRNFQRREDAPHHFFFVEFNTDRAIVKGAIVDDPILFEKKIELLKPKIIVISASSFKKIHGHIDLIARIGYATNKSGVIPKVYVDDSQLSLTAQEYYRQYCAATYLKRQPPKSKIIWLKE